MTYRFQGLWSVAAGRAWMTVLLGPLLSLLASPVQADPPTSPSQIAFRDGSIPPPFDDVARDLLGIELAREQFAPEFTGPLQSQDEFLAQHLSYLASLLEDAEDAGPASQAGLRRGLAYGRDLTSFALALMLCERSRGAGSPFLRPNIHNEYGTGGLDLAWRGLRELHKDPLWVDHEPEQAQQLHADAWRLKDSVVRTITYVAIGGAAVDAASLASGAWTLARLVALGPQLVPEFVRLSGLGRVAEFLRKLPQGGQARWLVTATAEGAGGPLYLVAGEGAAVRTLALTEAEVWALVQARRLGQTAAQLHILARELTPAGQARTQGLKGTNSVSGGGSRPVGFTSTQQWDTTKNATRLRKALEDKLGRNLTSDEEVHHIVPGTSRFAEKAREILDRCGIDINSVDNGVVLKDAAHRGHGLHASKAIQEVGNRLGRVEQAGGVQRVLKELREIASEIKAGRFKP